MDAPGNVLLNAASTGLPKDSVANITQLVTLDQEFLSERAGQITTQLMAQVDAGMRLVLEL